MMIKDFKRNGEFGDDVGDFQCEGKTRLAKRGYPRPLERVVPSRSCCCCCCYDQPTNQPLLPLLLLEGRCSGDC